MKSSEGRSISGKSRKNITENILRQCLEHSFTHEGK